MTPPTTQRTAHRECCTESKCESGLRNNYFEGKRLSVDSFRVEQNYLLERRRLLNRAIHGWGVVYGYKMTADHSSKETGRGRLKIGDGLALDQCGRELLQTKTLLEVDDVIVLDKKGVRLDRDNALSEAESNNDYKSERSPKECWLLSVHYAERFTAPVTIADPCRCEHHEWDHTCETVCYSLQRVSFDKCCRGFDCELNCDCAAGPCGDQSNDTNHATVVSPNRGGDRCLCEHLTKSPVPGNENSSLCEIEQSCARVRVDIRNGVPLACVELLKDDCDRWTFGEVTEACGPRRLVKRNDLLFDLIRGCDLTRISQIGWEDWLCNDGPISFEEFSDALGQKSHDQVEYVTNQFWVKFSRPVRKDTLRPDCFAMTVISVEREGGWWQTFRVPIVRVETSKYSAKGDSADHVLGATIVVDGAWVEDGVRGRRSLFLEGETRVELEVRGDFIIDCNGQTVDANAVGRSPFLPTGNGTPGGTFLSTFRVKQAPASGDKYTGDKSIID